MSRRPIIICVVSTWLIIVGSLSYIRWSGLKMMEILSIKDYSLEKFMVR